ncbi:hypothetical protein HBB16_18105 [Pseudonocardia sp. MCCB 268]|nr:hypothetical protein [Pseudonocardia cytotoxica]
MRAGTDRPEGLATRAEHPSFRYAAEILPYHDVPLDTALGELSGLGFTGGEPLVVGLTAGRARQPGRRPVRDPRGAAPARVQRVRPDLLREGPGRGSPGCGSRIDLEIDTVVFDREADYLVFVSRFLPPLLDEAQRLGVRIAVENHLTVPFSADFESGRGGAALAEGGQPRPDQAPARRPAPPEPGHLPGAAAPVGDERVDHRDDRLPERARQALLLLRLGHRPRLPARVTG